MAEPVLQVENLVKRFGSLTAVDSLSLEVQAGEVFGFLGPNGAGKTTSIRMMCGLLKPDEGRVLLHGKPLLGGDPETTSRVGVCPQEIVIWKKQTCMEQLLFIADMYGVSRKTAKQRAESLLEQMHLSEKRNKLAKTLSGGMQRRLNLILALVHDPDIIVLDEPEAGLDPQSRVLVREFIQDMASRKTVILTTHNMDEADRVADRVAIIDHGKLLLVDTPEELKKQAGTGDVLEISLSGATEESIAKARETLQSFTDDIIVHDSTLQVRAHGLIEKMPTVLETLHQAEIVPCEMNWRPTTLEDVFISLTGRGLRE